MKLRGFITLLVILIIPTLGWADTVPSTGFGYDLKTAGDCATAVPPNVPSDVPSANNYDLIELGFMATTIIHPGVLGQLSNVQYTASTDGSEYSIQGTISSTYGVDRVVAVTTDANGQSGFLISGQYKDGFCPVSGTSISCTYSVSSNPSLAASSKLLILLYTPDNSLIMVNKVQITKTAATPQQAQTPPPAPAPIPTSTSFILSDRCVDVAVAESNPVANQLSNLHFARTTTNDMDDVYLLSASFDPAYKGATTGQARELVAIDSASGQILTPKNIDPYTGNHRCVPSVTGTIANFGCQYQLKFNKITDDSQIRILIVLPNAVTLFNPKLLVAKDLVVTPPAPAPQPSSSCSAPTPVLELDGTCASICATNETLDPAKSVCACNDKFVFDPKTKSCVAATPNISAPTSPMYGNSCSLDPSTAPNPQTQTILALLLVAVIAARACYYSKN